MRDIVNNLAVISAIAPAVYAADNTPSVIDLLGFDSAMIAIHVGAGGITFTASNKLEMVLSHSDDGTNFDLVTDADLQAITGVAGGIIASFKAAHPDPTVHEVGYKGNRRYLKLLADFSGTHGTGTPLSAVVIKGNAAVRPVS
ncbi:hypothetical protein [Rhizobium sp. BE258]|uniref:hypothetical protein n=1 Tax=Rhizobium sp. BE258 TaxID=2817722 RepID=UPI002859D53E|nr:hypothetical protein [Rhizobium sp. BE258]MDR7147060.1 hypothetical protein [Rhizobium sp. BE258]